MITNEFSLKEAFKSSWQIYSSNFFLFFIPLLIWGGLFFLRFKLAQSSVFLPLLIVFTLLLVTFGIIKGLIKSYNEDKIKLSDFLLEGKVYFRLVIVALALTLFNKVSSFIFLFNRFSLEVGLTLVILLMLVFVFLFIRISFMICFIIDKKLNLKEALQASLKLTKNSSFDLYILLGVMSMVGLSGVFPGMFIGMIFISIPLNLGAFVFVYKNLLED